MSLGDIYSQVEYYDYSKPGVLEATVNGEQMGLGHFTQVVWKATTKIGCAAVSCADGTLFTGYGEVSLLVLFHERTLTDSPQWSSVNTKMQETSTSAREMLMLSLLRMSVRRSSASSRLEKGVQAGLVHFEVSLRTVNWATMHACSNSVILYLQSASPLHRLA
jgi:hypothetical protein